MIDGDSVFGEAGIETSRRPKNDQFDGYLNTSSINIEENTRQEASKAGLRYCRDDRPGIQRKKAGKDFVYLDERGKRIRDRAVLGRIKRLAIPPAWKDVWICPLENGHLQASGRDDRGRKQYRYHERWRTTRDESKFDRMIHFGRALPKIRRRVRRDLNRPGMPREKVLATVVNLLETSLIRVGNDEYARENHSYGLTTFKNRHARVLGDRIRFTFRGKSGRFHEISVQNRKLASIVRKCQDLPGQELFTYQDEEGKACSLSSHDVNDYLRSIAGNGFTAKDFRTWAGTVLTAVALDKLPKFERQTEGRKNIAAAIEAVAKVMGNTPAVCRKCYVHPVITDGYMQGKTINTAVESMNGHVPSQLKQTEAAVIYLLRQAAKGRRKKGPFG